MSRSLASVVKLVSAVLVGFIVNGVSANPPSTSPPPPQYNYNNNQHPSNELAATAREACKDDPRGAGVCLREFLNRSTGGGNGCRDSETSFRAAISAFTSACGKAGMGADCKKQVQRCQGCMSGGDVEGLDCGEPDVSSISGDLPTDAMEKIRNNLAGGVSGWNEVMKAPDYAKIRIKYNNCPALGAADYKSLQKEVEDGQKKVDDARKKIIEIQEQIQKINSERGEQQAKAKEEITKAKQEWEQKRDDIDKKFFEGNEQIMKELQQMRDGIENLRRENEDLVLKKNDEKIKRDQAISALRLKCNEIALTQVQQQRGIDFEKMKRNEYTAGDFSSMMSRAGLSTRDQYKQKALTNYNECLKSNIFTEGKNNIEQSYAQAIRIIDKSISDRNKRIDTVTQDMERTVQTKLGQKKLEYEKDISRVDGQYQDTYNNIITMQQIREDNFVNQLNVKSQQLQLAISELRREESYLQQKQQLLSLKRQVGDGEGDTKSTDVHAAMSAYDSVHSAALGVLSACCAADGETSGECARASTYVGENAAKEYINSAKPKSTPTRRENAIKDGPT